jgi:hypothetical protein
MTSEYDIPQSLLGLIENELSKDNPDKQFIHSGIDLIYRYISSIHSFSHKLAMGELKGRLHGGKLLGTTSTPNSDHFLSQFGEFLYVLKEMRTFLDEARERDIK